jgi:tRNA(fMet)-specific endonuclease VapC
VAYPGVTSAVAVDTDLVIDYLRGKGEGAAAIRRWLASGRLRLTVVTAFELRTGADFHDRKRDIDRLLARRVLPLDAEAALHAGAIWSELTARGQRIGLADSLHAGIARRFRVPFATRKTHHFERVPGLTLHSLSD